MSAREGEKHGLQKLCRAGVLVLLSAVWGCSGPNVNVRARRLPSGLVAVMGPLLGPFATESELAEAACELMTRQPGAASGLHGGEYCALGYYSRTGGGFFLSYLSDLKNKMDSGTKSCLIPNVLEDDNHLDAVVFWAPHTHPHNREFSRIDLRAQLRWLPTRIAEKGTGKTFMRSLLLFYREKTGECRIFRYELSSKSVLALRAGEWTVIGQVYDNEGNIKMVEGMDWLP